MSEVEQHETTPVTVTPVASVTAKNEPTPEQIAALAAAADAAQTAALARLDSMAEEDLITGYQAGKTVKENVLFLLEGTGIVPGNLHDDDGLVISAIRYDGEPLRACLDKLARPCGARWAFNGGALDFTIEEAAHAD